MIVDKLEHKELLLQIINKSNFPGSILESILELKLSIARAKIPEPPKREPEREKL